MMAPKRDTQEVEDAEQEVDVRRSFKDENSITVFTGDNTYSIETFIDEFEDAAQIMKWGKLEKLVYVKRLLHGTAKLFLRSCGRVKDYTTLKKELLEEFGSKIDSEVIHKKLASRKMKNDKDPVFHNPRRISSLEMDTVNKLSQHLKCTERELEESKEKHREVANTHGRIEKDINQKLFKLQEDFSIERGQLVRSLDENSEKLKVVENKFMDLEIHATELSNRIKELETKNEKLQDENSMHKNVIEVLKIKELELSSEYNTIRKRLEVEIDKYKEEVTLLKAESVISEVTLMEKVMHQGEGDEDEGEGKLMDQSTVEVDIDKYEEVTLLKADSVTSEIKLMEKMMHQDEGDECEGEGELMDQLTTANSSTKVSVLKEQLETLKMKDKDDDLHMIIEQENTEFYNKKRHEIGKKAKESIKKVQEENIRNYKKRKKKRRAQPIL